MSKDEHFIEYVKLERRQFVKIAAKYTVADHLQLRTGIESLLIAYDQMVERLALLRVVGRSEQLPCDECVDGQRWSPYYGKYVECDCRK